MTAAPPAAGPAQRHCILVVEGDPDISRLVSHSLERAGYAVLRASDGEEALRVALEERPDAVVLDPAMPRLDGYALTRALRADERTKRLPIVLLTARALPADVARGLEAGADEYVQKPFSPRDLVARIQRLLAAASDR